MNNFDRNVRETASSVKPFVWGESPGDNGQLRRTSEGVIRSERLRKAWDADKQEVVNQPPKTKNFEQIVADRSFDADNPPPRAYPIYMICGQTVCTPGNLTVISAQIKAGKSACIGGFIAASFGLEGDTLGIVSRNPHHFAVIHIDTEQPPDDHYRLVATALSRVGITKQPNWLSNKSICITGLDLSPKQRFALLEFLLEKGRKEHGGIHSVLIDGGADFLKDVNNIEESFSAVERLHRLAIEYKTTIICVIHFNPGTDKTRGHFGSQLARKAESNLELSKDQNEVTTIYTSSSRHAFISKTIGPRFKWNDAQGMHLSCSSKNAGKSESDDLTLARKIFQAPDCRNGVTWTQGVKRIEVIEKFSYATARRRLTTLISAKLLKRQETGKSAIYTLKKHAFLRSPKNGENTAKLRSRGVEPV